MEDKHGPGWVKASDGKVRFHFGAWLRAHHESQNTMAERWNVDSGLLTRWARYERKIGAYNRDGKTALKTAVFRSIKSATWKDYEDSFEFFHTEWKEAKEREQRVLQMLTEAGV